MGVFRLLARFRFLRGTAFDPFGYTRERRTERALISEYESTLRTLLVSLSHDNHSLAVRIASIPEDIRGFGHVKEKHLEAARACQAELLTAFDAPVPSGQRAA